VSAYDEGNLFARMTRGEVPAQKVFENADILAIMDIFPQSKGHVLVIPKAASRNLLDAEPTTLAKAIVEVQRIARAVNAAMQPAGIRLMQFNEAPAGQSVFHLHFHIVPVYEGIAVGRHGSGQQADAEELKHQAEAITAALADQDQEG
jgi:histidine triad (HIT) family protein